MLRDVFHFFKWMDCFCFTDSSKETKSQNPLDINFLSEVALHHTKMEYKYDMSTVNF